MTKITHLALFDLDNTLLGGDSDYLWGRFLAERRLVDEESYERENRRFYTDYEHGQLDIYAYLRFQLRFLADHERSHLDQWHRHFMAEKIQPIILPQGRARLQHHRQKGHTVLIITATNRFVTAPIAEALAVEHLLATELEEKEGRFTGNPTDIPCFQEGKVVRLQRWRQEKQCTDAETWFYSDSHNDIPLLESVDHPIAVDPDQTLRRHAQAKGWEIISFRH